MAADRPALARKLAALRRLAAPVSGATDAERANALQKIECVTAEIAKAAPLGRPVPVGPGFVNVIIVLNGFGFADDNTTTGSSGW